MAQTEGEVGELFLRTDTHLTDMINTLNNQSLSAAQKEANISALKFKYGDALNMFKSKGAELKAKLDATQNESQMLETQIREKKAELSQLRDQVKQSSSIANVRKEQAASLAQKHGANYASSVWLGLERPLRETSHMGLLVAGAACLLIALATLVFAIRARIFPVFGGGGGGNIVTTAARNFMGGGWRK